MLTTFTGPTGRNCSGMSRRSFLRAGSLGVAGLGLPWLLQQKAEAARSGRLVRDKAVVILFLDGGPSQIETFDPKMDGPPTSRSVVGEVQTSLPGVTIGGCFPRLARLAEHMAIVRSYHTRNFDHNPGLVLQVDSEVTTPRVERRRDEPSWGSYYARLAGPIRPSTGLPNHVLLLPTAIDSSIRARADGTGPGKLGAAYAPFSPGGNSDLSRNLTLNISPERLTHRRSLLTQFDRLKREIDGSNEYAALDHYQQQAYQILTGDSTQRAFDLSREAAAVVDRYDTSEFRIAYGSEDVRRNSPHALGRQLLLARRLCEAGCGFVVVSSLGWDMHGRPNDGFFGMPDGMRALGPAVDKAVSAFIEDVHSRGLSDQILLVICGEMGREPRFEGAVGRDHWGRLAPLVLVGGGLKMGQVIGRSDRTGGMPATEPIETYQLACTIMQTLIDVGEARTQPDIPPSVVEFLSGRPIGELM